MGSIIKNITGSLTGSTAVNAAGDASAAQQGYQQQAIDYLKQQDKLPTEFRDFGLKEFADASGLKGVQRQQDFIDQSKQSALYQAIIGTKQAGEDSILRNASATGGLRSGNVQEALAEHSQQVDQNALLQAFNQQLGGAQSLAGLGPSNSSQIASLTSGIGQTQAQGITAAAQARDTAAGNALSLGTSIAGFFSDRRLKSDVKKIGTQSGYNVYSWVWNSKANAIGLIGKSYGVIADEVKKICADAVGESKGYETVNYEMIGVKHD